MLNKYWVLISLFSLLFFNGLVWGQCDGDIQLFNQEDVDNFPVNYGCTEMTGNLEIGTISASNDIVDLEGLAELVSIGGILRIANNDLLKNLQGLNSLETIGDQLFLLENDSLENLSGLGNLDSIGGDIRISYNPLLEDLDSLTALSHIGEDIWIQKTSIKQLNIFQFVDTIHAGFNIANNDSLKNLQGLNNLVAVQGFVSISNNDSLSNLDALSSLNFVGDRFVIEFNDNLVNLQGLEQLSLIGDELLITNNEHLMNLDGLNGLSSIEGSLKISFNAHLSEIDALLNLNSVSSTMFIEYNASLQHLNGFYGLISIGNYCLVRYNDSLQNIDGLSSLTYLADDISIYDNPLLSECCIVPEFLDLGPGFVVLYTNAEGCNSLEEATAVCTLSELKVRAFNDENGNGQFDGEDFPLYGLHFGISPGAFFAYDQQQRLSYFVEMGEYDVLYNSSVNALWQTSNAFENIEIGEEQEEISLSFAMQSETDIAIHGIDLTSSITRCNQNTNVWITFENKGTIVTDGFVRLVSNDLPTFVSSNPPIDSISNDTLFWFYENLLPTHSIQIKAIFEMPGVDFIEETMGWLADIQTWEEEAYKKAVLGSELICAYDPNDKLVSPQGIGVEHYTLLEENDFEYTIRFQNTGNDTAFNVVIKDLLSEYLILESFDFIASSHSVETEMNKNTRLLTFTFNDIYLPDSNVNEPASHGFVKFRVDRVTPMDDFTNIENTAQIFFDSNPPIVTNTTLNRMVTEIPTSIQSVEVEEIKLHIYPNPSDGKFYIALKNFNTKVFRAQVRDIQGALIWERKLEDGTGTLLSTVDLGNVQSGLYFVMVEMEDGCVLVEKFLVE